MTAGIQAQDPPAARLSFRSRSRRLTAADVDRARTEERSLLRTWLMRKTIHIVPTEDAGWMLSLFESPIERWSRRRLEQLGMPHGKQERALRAIATALDDGPLTRSEAAERITEAGIALNAQTRLHAVGLAVTSGLAVLGPDRGAQSMLVRREDWIGALPPVDRDRALAELARRYISAFGPATDRDFAYWSGLSLRDVRAGLSAISPELVEIRVGEERMVVLRGGRPRLPRPDQVRMLGGFDTYLLGYKDRGFATGDEHRDTVSDGGGGIYPVIVRDGVVEAGWRVSRKRGELEISIDDREFPRELQAAIDREIADIRRFEARPVTLTGNQYG
ncbi:MAG TPA: winged helix DNA-binding domain-containing protein [Solirubrobacterales bacterium]|nr:winged helix DNA-binding domain-containing protein [Solirubrobacterales bacterium]